ncbi:DUF4913 domain-containing protein [Streptomyces sp. Da 82-17]|uniref:DUF4913 domain-containing protein n=1 Tax=Streptomyces sp. Da 82-17 TaxID=3377116 RepID=UPI0038D40095
MSDSPQDDEPVRVPDHDLDDLASTVARLVAESHRQRDTLSRLTDEQPTVRSEGSVVDEVGREGDVTSTPVEPSPENSLTSVFILALDGKTYENELTALTRWVHDLLLPVYGREITANRPWCRQWQEHPEAIARLHGLWLAWQQLTDVQAGLAGPSTWHRDHLDPTLMQLRAPDGPFAACTTSPARPTHRLLASPEPEEA